MKSATPYQKRKACVSIPIYKAIPDPLEESSLIQCLNVLKNYPMSLICPESLDVYYYFNIISRYTDDYFRFDFSDKYFTSTDAYSKLMLSENFYLRHNEFEFILIYQLDCWVFRDELTYWCERGYDYIGAPWFKGCDRAGPNAKLIEPSGNGGLSLRKVATFRTITSLVDFTGNEGNEDVTIAKYFPRIVNNFKIAPVEAAMRFSFEVNPRRLFEMTGALPFGCHAFERYDFKFWSTHINFNSLSEHRREYMSEHSFNDKSSHELFELMAKLDIGFEIDWKPHRKIASSWVDNTPFAFWLIKILKPRILVELGTYQGASLMAFCQAVNYYGFETRCYGVDTWRGDIHAGFYDDKIYNELNNFCSLYYSSFCKLQRQTFDNARQYFLQNEIDLLHIDGLHTYDAVKHDFETWRDAVSDNGVVLFHDTNIRRDNFGVYKFWDEISRQYPHFEFYHGAGLGVLGLGNALPEPLKYLFSADNITSQHIRTLFGTRGIAVNREMEIHALLTSRSWKIAALLRKASSCFGKIKKYIARESCGEVVPGTAHK